MGKIDKKTEHFLKNETQFHLGFLPTEQPHPETSGLDKICREDISAGIEMLLKVDRDIPPKASQVLDSEEFKELSDSMKKSLDEGGKIVFSGCGSTGRLSILLEASWRKACRRLNLKEIEDRVFSIMTGGDYALIRSVEAFEDYESFGRRQTQDMGIGTADTFIGVTEGGETSSVLGSAMQAAEDGARVFLVFNNPAELLCERIERSRKVLTDPRVTSLDLCTGPMAVAGSTRMQAVTAELLVLGYAMEKTLTFFYGTDSENPVKAFTELLDDLTEKDSLERLADFIEYEEGIYSQGGLVTYFADKNLLNIFTDTTERAPTFMLPPFVKYDDNNSTQSWAFVKNPLQPTGKTWEQVLGRKPRCLEWGKQDYKLLGASEKIINNPPPINFREILRFKIGSEKDEKRFSGKPSAAIAVLSVSDMSDEIEKFLDRFNLHKEDFSDSRIFFIGEKPIIPGMFNIPCRIKKSPINLWEHLAIKIVMNTVSTVTMARMGRLQSNWMSWVETTNKKLIDRATRLIAELAGLPYEDSCRELFTSIYEIENTEWKGKQPPSPVQYTLSRLASRDSSG
jgi:N-acetylmuramic acid 6-phosphate etherase